MEILKRVQSPTPKFFKGLQKICLTFIGIAGALIGAEVMGTIELSENISQGCTYLMIIGGAILGTAQTAKE